MLAKAEPILHPDQTVMQVIQEYPETIPVWIALKMDCAGCHLTRFCSLEYVAESYKVKLETLMEEMEKAILAGNRW